MPKYSCYVTFDAGVGFVIEADSEAEAAELALDRAGEFRDRVEIADPMQVTECALMDKDEEDDDAGL